jgi:hypothetical protein
MEAKSGSSVLFGFHSTISANLFGRTVCLILFAPVPKGRQNQEVHCYLAFIFLKVLICLEERFA